MRGTIQDVLRWVMGLCIACLGALLTVLLFFRVRSFGHLQRQLQKRYGVKRDTPVLSYGPELERLIQKAAEKSGTEVTYALTSGSTAAPKRILYTRRRVRIAKRTYADVFARCYWALPIRRKSLYILSAFDDGQSLTSMLLRETGFPTYLSTLQAPYRAETHPALRDLAHAYGSTALRFWIMVIANPGVLFATNPSTLSTYLDRLTSDWLKSAALVRAFVRHPQQFNRDVHRIARRLNSRGAYARLETIASSTSALPFPTCVPGVEAYVTWDGGYVKPFLDRVASYLPPDRYRHIPMYSMSTESIETIGHFGGNSVTFLPMAKGVLYEFLDEELEDRPENLRAPDALKPGKTYSMVISDAYGLRRYQTGDLFLCRGFLYGVPDLHFVGRRGLEYSFTGEKITAEQVTAVFHDLRRSLSCIPAAAFLTTIPSLPEHESVPHYKVVVVGSDVPSEADKSTIARFFDERLREINLEYRSKVDSGRLAKPRAVHLGFDAFIHLAGGEHQRDSWESQFKFLPLYCRTWESLQARAEEAAAS